MSERRNRELYSIPITGIDSRGRGRGMHTAADGRRRPVAVSGALPGDVVDVRVSRRKGGTILGETLNLRETDHPRTIPFCRHYGDCGGCTTQDLVYEDQLLLKEAVVQSSFREAGMEDVLEEADLRPILPASRERFYRNKLEYSFGAQRWLTDREVQESGEIHDRRGLGFHAPGRFDRVLDISECHLQPEPSGRIREFMRSFADRNNLSFYDARGHHGLLRLLIIRTALTGEVMVTVMFGEDDPASRDLVMNSIARRFPEITSLNYVVNTSSNDSIFAHEVVLWSGEPYITERCGPNLLRIRPKAFYQTNPEQAVRLYRTAVESAYPDRDHSPGRRDIPLVFDLYSGIGSIALFIAHRAVRVVGIESVPDAIRAARENAELNGIVNAIFEEGEVEKVLPVMVERYGVPDLVVVDPPRAGLHPAARTALVELAAERIVYVSCNPRSQATDIRELSGGYRVSCMQPVDMFPQTRHVENVAVLVRRD